MNDLGAALETVVTSSRQLTTWALSIGAGSVLAIISTSYIRPKSLKLRLPYLLFMPGWCLLGYSIFLGERLTRSYIASILNSKDADLISSYINDLFATQRETLLESLVFFLLWLVAYLLMWIFSKSIDGE